MPASFRIELAGSPAAVGSSSNLLSARLASRDRQVAGRTPHSLRPWTDPAGFIGHRNCLFVVTRRCRVQVVQRMAATNKDLARSNKSDRGARPTNKRSRKIDESEMGGNDLISPVKT